MDKQLVATKISGLELPRGPIIQRMNYPRDKSYTEHNVHWPPQLGPIVTRTNSEMHVQKAEAQLAYELQAAKIQQRIRNEEIQIQVNNV